MKVDPELLSDIKSILASQQTSPFFKNFLGGPYVREFEKAFARYVGTRHAVSMANGTLALNAAYTALGIDKLSEVIVSPWTFVATASEIVRAGYKPVFADVDPNNGALSAQATNQAITPRTGAIVLMHPLGSMCKVDDFALMAAPLRVVEDSCQALRRGIRCWGDIAIFSFQQTKSASTGEGAMAVTDNGDFYDRLCYLRNHGEKYSPMQERFHNMIGTNLRLTEIQAVIGLYALRDYDKVVKHQLMLGQILKEAMEESNWLQPQEPWTENGYIFAGKIVKNCVHGVEGIWRCTGPALKIRASFLEKVKRWNKGVPGAVIGPGYSELIYELPAFRSYARPCSIAKMWCDHAIWMDVRRMPVATVKELARTVEKMK
jgi:dTDP-4-amino-4,6-dideoxygalactose transaminase